jgi:hypothetical protein
LIALQGANPAEIMVMMRNAGTTMPTFSACTPVAIKYRFRLQWPKA